MGKIVYKISGMHCKSCEILIEDKLKELENIKKINVDCNKEVAEIFFDSEKPDEKEIKKAIEKLGYILISEVKNGDKNDVSPTLFSRNISDYKNLLIAFVIFISLYMLFSLLKLDKLFYVNTSMNSFSIITVLIIGLTAGFSTCMALVGGLVMGISTKYLENKTDLKFKDKIKPHLFFNLGRIVLFFIFGGILGSLGSLFKISLSLTGYFTIFVGIVMFLMGIQLLNIFPFISKLKITLPKSLARLLKIDKKEDKYTNKAAFMLGGLTFFLPCGFTQAMQLYAISSGNFLTGALVMSLFAIGTSFGLMGIGSLTSLIDKRASKIFFKVIGIFILFFAIFNIKNGYNLSLIKNETIKKNNVENVNDRIEKQLITASFNIKDDISLTSFRVKIGEPVRFEIMALQNGSGCMSTIMIPGVYNTPEYIKIGLNVLEFTPNKKGVFPITCAMGVKRGELIVE